MQDLARQVRRLRVLNAFTLVVLALVLLTGFQENADQQRISVLDVERINVVEPDGTLRLTISNSARLPDPILDGKAYPLRQGHPAAGLVFFNDAGDEQGGMIWHGAEVDGQPAMGASVTFDAWRQDQTIQMSHSETEGHRWTGLRLIDRPPAPLGPALDKVLAARALPEGPARDSAMAALTRSPEAAALKATQRLQIGRTGDGSAVVTLSDVEGRPRLMLAVDSLGVPTVKLMDSSGRVTWRTPGG